MTSNRNFKQRVRARAAKTGESYTAARRQIRPPAAPGAKRLRLAVAQTGLRQDPLRAEELQAGGREVRDLMRAAAAMNARVVHFSEGAVCFPHKRLVMSDPGGWDLIDWTAWREELAGIARLAGELRLWTVIGSAHQLTAPNRPYNSLYVISDGGEVVSRYDERMLSSTKISWMYAPGSVPVTFEVDGVRFGCLLGFDSHVEIAVRKARGWRRTARSGIFGPHMVTGDPRSDDRRDF